MCCVRSTELIDFTPYGYLRNPAHQATSWAASSGGNLRTAADTSADGGLGVEWAYPVGRDPCRRVGLGLETIVDGRPCRTRADFAAIGLVSRYHSCLIFGVEWQVDGIRVDARYFLADEDALAVRVVVENHALGARQVAVSVIGQVDAKAVHTVVLTDTPCPHVALGVEHAQRRLEPGERRTILAVLARGAEADAALTKGRAALASAEAVYRQLLIEDAEFYARCPTLSGDWPAHWREGLHHDFETTRLLVQPAGGIFADVWPSWMVAWPRAVLAEGVLDMVRLAYADPVTAQRAVLSLFRDAPQPNVPCVFRDGEYNMVAADGSRCGTSPAWCLPFLNLELLYLRTLDRHWLALLYPYAAAFINWWLANRTDADGWLVYKCTWESGEDGNPRLDPSGSGAADTSGHVRPVELQATTAHAAGVLAFFAAELDMADDVPRWRRVERDYRVRTRQLFDAATGRYRDWLIGAGCSQAPCPDQAYWGVDACRFSAQSLTPLLIGEPLAEAEVWQHCGPPWTCWPSWTVALVESAAAAGLYSGVGQLAFETVDRVYRVTTRRDLGSLARPLPGSSPEFWPTDWRTYGGSDAYGWGATTANLLIRHLFGFKESRLTDGWVVELAPAFPAALLEAGRRYGIRRLNYRGLNFDLAYTVLPDGLLAELELATESRSCVVQHNGVAVYASSAKRARHQFRVPHGAAVGVRLR